MVSRIGDPRYDPDNNPNYSCEGCGVPVEVRLYNITDAFVLNSEPWEPDNGEWRKGYAAGLFVQDTVTIANKVTIVGGPTITLAPGADDSGTFTGT